MKSVAIIGTGIAGLACAYMLRDKARLTVYEQNDYVGGHTNTIDVLEEGKKLPLDTGFMVYNEVTYPHLTKLFNELGVESKPTDMSFSVQNKDINLEWSGTGFNKLFGQRRNLVNIRFWKFLLELDRFNKVGVSLMNDPSIEDLNLRDFITREKFSEDALNLYLLPMMSALWSAPPDTMLRFPASTLLRFMFTHGLLSMYDKHQWLTVRGGARTYVEKMTKSFKENIRLNSKVVRIAPIARSESEDNSKTRVICADGSSEEFDVVILGCHGDQAFEILHESYAAERALLSNFSYQSNQVFVHTDSSVMPDRKLNWASWNYLVDHRKSSPTTTHYWMNSLQGISDRVNYFVSLNADSMINPSSILRQIEYYHPIFTVDAIEAQKLLPQLNRTSNRNVFLCGSYFSHGFHEDAIASSIDVVKIIEGGVLERPNLLPV